MNNVSHSWGKRGEGSAVTVSIRKNTGAPSKLCLGGKATAPNSTTSTQLQSNSTMFWKDLIAEVPTVGSSGDSAAPIAGIEYDSRRVRPGSVFVAMKGGSTDGNRYIDKAIAAGALGILTDSSPTFDHLVVYTPEIPVLEVEHGRRALAEVSAAFFGHPEKKLKATGITGTNGKTTTAY